MKILVAIDGSSDSLGAAQTAARIVNSQPTASVVIVTVVNPPDLPIETTGEMWLPELIQQQQEIAANNLEQAKRCFEPSSADVTVKILAGHVSHAIIDEAKQLDCDLIVVGAKGHSMIERILLGSVSDDVATHATTSVLVCRGDRDAMSKPSTAMRATVGYDGSESANRVIDDLTGYPWTASMHLQVVFVTPMLDLFGQQVLPTTEDDVRRRRELAQQKVAEAVGRLSRRAADTRSVVVTSDHVGEAILQAADDHHSELIVVGDKGHGFVARLFIGSTSRYVLRHATQSVLIAR